MWREKLHKFLTYRYGDTLTHLFIGAGMLFLLNTVIVYDTKNFLNKVTLIAGIIFFIIGILYKELIYDKGKEKDV